MTPFAARAVLQVLSLAVICAVAPEATADYYKYVDSKGTVCITNKLDAVPSRYRATMKLVRDDAPVRRGTDGQQEAASPPPDTVAAPVRETVPREDATGWFGQMAARYAWFKPLAIIGGFFAGFLVVAKVAALLPSPQLARLICLVYFLGIFLFAYKAYADHLASSCVAIKEKVVTMFKKANEREKR